MSRGTTLFLRGVIVLVGIGTVALLLWEPHLEGRNAHATTFEIYFKDPFLAYAYVASIPFFMGLNQAFKALGYAERDKEFSPEVVRCLRTIKYCAIAIIAFVAGGEVIIMSHDSDDNAGGVAVGLLIILASVVVATAMAVLERTSRRAVEPQVDE